MMFYSRKIKRIKINKNLTICIFGVLILIVFCVVHFENSIHGFSGDSNKSKNGYSKRPRTIFVITPTKVQWTQIADLTRLSQTLRLVPNIHWIIVEDSLNKTNGVKDVLDRFNRPHTQLAVKATPEQIKAYKNSKGMIQRSQGLEHMRRRFILNADESMIYDKELDIMLPANDVGVVYFADDDNSYDLELFNFMKQVDRIGVWAVGLVGGVSVEHPKVVNNTVVGWNVGYMKKRKFALDMAGFAVNLELIVKNRNASFHSSCRGTLHESCFMEQLNTTLAEIQPFGFGDEYLNSNKRKRVFVWHTKTSKVSSKTKNLTNEYDV